MKVANVENYNNTTNFQGKVFVDPDLSYYPCKFVRKHFDKMSELMKEKPYDLFIKQDHGTDNVHLLFQKQEHLGKRNAPKHTVLVNKNVEFYDIATECGIKEMDELNLKNQKSTKDKVVRFFKDIRIKFLSMLQD